MSYFSLRPKNLLTQIWSFHLIFPKHFRENLVYGTYHFIIFSKNMFPIRSKQQYCWRFRKILNLTCTELIQFSIYTEGLHSRLLRLPINVVTRTEIKKTLCPNQSQQRVLDVIVSHVKKVRFYYSYVFIRNTKRECGQRSSIFSHSVFR